MNFSKRRSALIAACIAAGMTLSACGGDNEKQGGSGSAAEEGQGGELVEELVSGLNAAHHPSRILVMY